MSAGDILITIVIWLYKSTLLHLPTEVSTLSLATLTGYLDGFKDNLIYAFSGISKLFSIELLITFVLIIITAELFLLLFKTGIFIINLIRGSGA